MPVAEPLRLGWCSKVPARMRAAGTAVVSPQIKAPAASAEELACPLSPWQPQAAALGHSRRGVMLSRAGRSALLPLHWHRFAPGAAHHDVLETQPWFFGGVKMTTYGRGRFLLSPWPSRAGLSGLQQAECGVGPSVLITWSLHVWPAVASQIPAVTWGSVMARLMISKLLIKYSSWQSLAHRCSLGGEGGGQSWLLKKTALFLGLFP